MLFNHLLPLLPKRIYCILTNPKLSREEGLGTIEMVILMAVLIGLAFLFKGFIKDVFDKIKGGISMDDLGNASKIK